MKYLIVAVAVLIPSIAGAAELKVTFSAAPDGATLIETTEPLPQEVIDKGVALFGARFMEMRTRTWGTTPITIKYDIPRRWKDCLQLRPMTVRWISGAEASITLTACPANGKNQAFRFTRPTGVPGAEVDATYAVQLQQLALLQAQAASQEAAALQQSLTLSQQNLQLQQQTWAIQRARHCTSQLIGTLVYTNCY